MVKVKEDMTGWKMWEHGVPDSRLIVICRTDDYISPKGKHIAQWLVQDARGENPFVVMGIKLRNGKTKGHIKFNKRIGRCIEGYNDIVTLYKNETVDLDKKYKLYRLIQSFPNKESDAKNYTPNSKKTLIMQCPDCGAKINKMILTVYKDGFGCPICSDHISYPNKFIHAFIKQLPVINIDTEWTTSWLKTYKGRLRFDVYFEYNNKKYVIEADGKLGHGKTKYKSLKQDIDGKQRDEKKDKLANEHNIVVIRIDCIKSEREYIKTSILSSVLNDMFDLSNIDWVMCDIQAQKNIVKEICEFYNQHPNMYIRDIAKIFSVHPITVGKRLKQGNEFGWCKYDKNIQFNRNRSKIARENYGKGVVRIGYNGTEVYYKTLIDAARALGKKSSSAICQCCKGILPHAYGYRWRYVNHQNKYSD